MIKYDYEIDRLIENRKFSPVSQYTDLENFSVIRGKNAIGKSTLLHLLAFALYGYDERSFKGQYNQINPILKEKINQFHSKEQKVRFSFELEGEGSDHKLCSEKTDDEDFPTVFELVDNGKKNPLSFEKFTQKYCVIYDIPDKPTDRISNLVEDVKVINDRLISKLDLFCEHLALIFDVISNSQDPRKIEDLRNSLAEIEVKLEPMRQNITEIQDTLVLLELMINKYEYNTLMRKIDVIQGKLSNLKTRKTNNAKEIKQKQKLKDAIRIHFSKIKLILEKAVLESAQVREIYDTEQFTRLKERTQNRIKLDNWDWKADLHMQLSDYKEFLKNIYSQYSLDYKVAGIIEKMLDLLRELDRTGESIPKVKIPELIQSFKDSHAKHTEEKNIAQKIVQISEMIEQAEIQLANFKDAVDDLGEDSSSLYTEYDIEEGGDCRKIISELQHEYDSLQKQKEGIKRSMAKSGINIDVDEDIPNEIRNAYPYKYEKYRTKSQIELIDLKEEKLKRLREQDQRIKDLQIKQHIDKQALDSLLNKEKHPLLDKKDVINQLHNNTLDLKNDIIEYNDYFEIIRDGHMNVTEKIAFYNKSISKYFARKLGKIPYIKDYVEVQEVDYLKKQFVLAGSGKIVKFDYFSTGQAQCIYIKSMLNQNMDKKVILLLDEISSMDEETMQIIYDEIKIKRESGNLLAAILAEKSNVDPSVEVL